MKVYISATYRDLKVYRQAVASVLRRMGHQVIGMEDYVAEGARPLDRCLKDVADCDVYVGIFAWRYGSIPKTLGLPDMGLPPNTSIDTTSATEFEYRQAEHLMKPMLVFLVAPDAEWPSSQFDAIAGKPEDAQAIARLREEAGQRYLISHFRTPEELASLVSAAVYREEIGHQMDIQTLHVEATVNSDLFRRNSVSDTTILEITRVIGGAEEISALWIKIGQGRDWWMSRLYFLCSLAADLTLIGTVIFTGLDDAFLGIVHPRVVMERLSLADNKLQAYERQMAADPTAGLLDLDAEIRRRADLWEAEMSTTGGEGMHPTFVTARALRRWLEPYWITQSLDLDMSPNSALHMQRLLDWPQRFVPVVKEGKFTQVVDKQALTEQVAKMFIREQVSRALSMIR